MRYSLRWKRLRVKDGRVWEGKTLLETEEEENVFNIWAMRSVDPELREITKDDDII